MHLFICLLPHTHIVDPAVSLSTPTHSPDLSSGLEGGLGEVGIDVLHMLLAHLLQGSEEETGMSPENIETFVQTLRRGREMTAVPSLAYLRESQGS